MRCRLIRPLRAKFTPPPLELDSLGGVSTLSKMMKIDLKTGLKESEVRDSYQ